MAKSADAFRTISEVADWLETPAHVLRFWESKFAQVKPVKRAGGRRYYRPSDMLLLGGIKKLLHTDGMTIKGVQKLLREHGIKHVAAHSQPLDDITAAADKAVTIEAEAARSEAPATSPVLSAAPQVDQPAPAPPAPPQAAAAEPAETTSAPSAPPEAGVTDTDDTEDVPVMPSFSHRPAATEEPAETPEPEQETAEEAAEPAPPAPTPSVVTTPDDPADDIDAEPGILAQMSALKAPVSDDMADRLGDVLERLRQGSDGNGTGQNS